MGITGISYTQTNILIKTTEVDKKETTENSQETIKNFAKRDLLDINTQINMLDKSYNKDKDYQAIEKKLGIDSSKWGVEAVSDDIFNFAKIVYEKYKLNHSEEESKKVLDDFYNIAKKAISQGFGEAKDYLGTLPDDVGKLMQGTFDRTMEKLDNWYKNGGVDTAEETTSDTETTPEAETQDTAKPADNKEKLSNIQSEIDYRLSEAEDMKNQIVDMLKQQGIYLEEQKTKKPSFDIKG